MRLDSISQDVRSALRANTVVPAVPRTVADVDSNLPVSQVEMVDDYDPATFVVVAVLFVLIAALASYVPARRATRIDPLSVLRYE